MFNTSHFSLAVICALHPGRGHLLQHLLLPEAALLPGAGTQRWRGCSARSERQSCGWCLHAAVHCHQDALWGEQQLKKKKRLHWGTPEPFWPEICCMIGGLNIFSQSRLNWWTGQFTIQDHCWWMIELRQSVVFVSSILLSATFFPDDISSQNQGPLHIF